MVLARAEIEGHRVPGELLSLVFFVMLKRNGKHKAESDGVVRKKVMNRSNH